MLTGLLLLLSVFSYVATEKRNVTTPKTCGVRHPDGVGFYIRDIRDSKTQFGEFPWMVAVLTERDVEPLLVYQCGGSLIHPQIVMTSAHCVLGTNKQFTVRAGEWDAQFKNEPLPHQDRHVTDIIVHPDYHRVKHYNDVAVLILNRPVDIAENVDTVCLPQQSMVVKENTTCYASGWGKDSMGKEGRYQVILKKTELPILSKGVCQERLRTTRLGKHFKLHKSFICAGGEEGRDTCKGDGGSPLVCPILDHPNRYFQAGIVSWGIGCGENRIPGVYANVAQFVNWIHERIHNLERSN